MNKYNGISLEQAQKMVTAAITKSAEMNVAMNIVIMDAGANLVAFARMDGAWLGSIDIAMKKAKTARYFDMPTAKIGELSQPGKSLYNIEVSNGGLISFGGGFPIMSKEGAVIGAIGVSGGAVEEDEKVAQAGLDAMK